MNLNDWFNKGITINQYMESLEKHSDGFNHIYEQFALPEDEAFYQSLKDKNLRVLVLAEPWCSHCMLNIPLLLRLTEKVDIPLSILPRDENSELMNQYLTDGKQKIPVFIFIDKEGNEVTTWGPIAETTDVFMTDYKNTLPDKDDPLYDEVFKNMVKSVAKGFSEDEKLWNGAYLSMKNELSL